MSEKRSIPQHTSTLAFDYLGRKMIFYQGYPLYTYVGDKKPGDFNAPLPDNSPW